MRILLAVRDPWLAASLRDALLLAPALQLAGIVDPTIDRALGGWNSCADIVLIGADELLWLQRSGSGGSLAGNAPGPPILLLAESPVLHLFYQIHPCLPLFPFLPDQPLPPHRLPPSVAGFFVFPS